ncbi:hypothetical protein ACPVTF_14980 [Geobacillus icigianus]
MVNLDVFYKLKCWMFWKAKIRWKQIWGNYKLFNLPNPYIASIFSFVPRILGVLITLILGFVIGYTYSHFLQFDAYYLWIIIFLLFLFDGVSDGLKTGKWISNTKEEDWLLTSCSLGNIEYLLFRENAALARIFIPGWRANHCPWIFSVKMPHWREIFIPGWRADHTAHGTFP